MSRTAWIRIFAAVLIASAALLLIRMHNAHGAAQEESISAGRHLAEAWCRKCHAFESADPQAGIRAPAFAGIANRPSTTETSLKAFLLSNHRNMPGLIFSPGQTDDLVHFILSLKHD
jgi:cytochrome c